MTGKEIKSAVEYWRKTAEHDYQTMEYLFKGKKFVEFLNQVNDFNIRARYPEQKLKFYKKSTAKYTEVNLNKIKDMYKNLCQKLK